MTEFRIEADSVAAVGSRARQLANDLENALSTADREVAALSDSWTGAAGTAYLRGWQEMHDGGRQIFAALRALGDSLGVTVEKVAVSDGRAASSILSLS